jgi:biotin transport system ATP-binding protein
MLTIKNLTHRFPDGTLGLDDVNLSITKGELVVLTGKNGSGKTVLAKHCNGLLVPTSGEVIFEGLSVRRNLRLVRQRVGLVFQNANSQFVGQTVADDVEFGPRNLKLPNEEIQKRVEAALESTGLLGLRNARPYTLSGGEKRRLAIAGVLAMEPSLVILDEPFSSLDYPGVKQVLEQVVRIHGEGKTLVIITHELEKVLGHATRLVIMERGRICGDGAPDLMLDRVEEYGVRKPCVPDTGIGGITWLTS